MAKKIIALAGDYNYIIPITTTIKSISYHVRNFKLYLINMNIPQEWFYRINKYLRHCGSEIVDLKISADTFAKETQTHHSQINEMTFGCLLIPDLIPEDRVLYIDSDAIVDDNIDELFQLDLGDHPLGAINDVFFYDFNAGVLLFNNRWFKQQKNIVSEMLEYGQNPDLLDADQSVLNHFFGDSYLPLDLKYNYVIGYDRDVFYLPENSPHYFEMMAQCQHPKIIHYASSDKPWNLTSSGRMRNLWWKYFDLDWPEIVSHSTLPNLTPHPKGSFLTFTASDNLSGIKALATALPQIEFYIAAWTTMSPHLMQLTQHHNVRLYPNVSGPMLQQFQDNCTGYLDINDGPKEVGIMEKFMQNGRPIISVAGRATDLNNYRQQIIVPENNNQQLVAAVTQMLESKKEE